MIKKIALLFIGLLAGVNLLMAQAPTDDEIRKFSTPEKFDVAVELMSKKQYYQALRIWLIMLEDAPDNANYNYKTGVCYLQQNIGKTKALPYLEKACANTTKNYDPYFFGEEKAPIDAYFYLGQAYHLNYQFDKAIEMFNKFRNEASKKHILQPEVDHQIAMANNAKYEIANPRQANTEVINLGPNINSPYSDYSPVISLDENALFFTSRRLRADSSNILAIIPDDGKYYEDVYVSFRDKNTGEWQPAQMVDLYNRIKENEATIAVSADGQKLYLYHDVNGDGNIYYTEYVDGNYSEMEPVGEHVNSASWETHITFTPDEKTLYFVSDRPGGLGGRDIYRCTRLPNGEWSKPYNLGAPINTPFDEDAPFISADGKTLYFSSNSSKSMGGFDIFFSVFNDDGTISEPTPIGVPINSVDDDVFFITSADGKRGYFSSVREDTYGEKDIYMIQLDTTAIVSVAILKGYINVPKGQVVPNDIVIYVSDLTEGSDPTEYKPRPQDGSYVFVLTPCHEYLVDYQQNGNTFHQYEFQVPCEAGYQEIEKVLLLDAIGMGVVEDSIPDTTSTSSVAVTEPNTDPLAWKIKGFDKLKDANTTVDYLDENGNVIYTEKVDDEGLFKYRKLKDDKSYIFRINTADPTLCNKTEILLVDDKRNIVGKTVRDDRCKFTYNKKSDVVNNTTEAKPASFEKYYNYNKKGVNSDKDFAKFVNNVANIIKVNGTVSIDIESSASKVPTSTFGTNDNLAKMRLNEAKEKLLNALKAKGVDVSKVRFVSEVASVQGPEYNDDFLANRKAYEQYQYVKIKAQ